MLENLQREKRAEIVDAWVRAALAVYPTDTAALFERGKDPFANPVGASVRDALGPLFDAFVSDTPVQEYVPHLDRIIKVRCVQDVPPSQAVGFIFLLKEILGKALAPQPGETRALEQFQALDARIDRMAACGFDVYAACMRKMADIRVREMKASVATIMRMSKLADSARNGAGPEKEAGD